MDLAWGAIEQIRATHDVSDALVSVVNYDRQLIGEDFIGAQYGEVIARKADPPARAR